MRLDDIIIKTLLVLTMASPFSKIRSEPSDEHKQYKLCCKGAYFSSMMSSYKGCLRTDEDNESHNIIDRGYPIHVLYKLVTKGDSIMDRLEIDGELITKDSTGKISSQPYEPHFINRERNIIVSCFKPYIPNNSYESVFRIKVKDRTDGEPLPHLTATDTLHIKR